MSSALALEGFGFDEFEVPTLSSSTGAQTLLIPTRRPSAYLTQGAAVAVYLLALTGLALYSAHPAPPAEEDAVELVMLPPAAPEEQPAPPPEPPPPVAEEIPQPPEPDMPPPPPVAEEPAVAPVAPVEPPKPKPAPKPVVKPVEHKPAPQPHAAQSTSQAPTNVPPNALASGYANQVHARIAAAAAAVVPRAALAAHQAGRVGYHIVISPSGSVVSQSITPSGNPAFDTAATQALARTSFPATGMTRNAALSGAIVFR